MYNCLIKIILCLISFLSLIGCSTVIPSNYLGPLSINSVQKVNNTSMSPRVIPVNVSTLTSPEGKRLLDSAMKPQPYRIGVYDNLHIIVWGHPELSTVATAPIVSGGATNGTSSSNSMNTPLTSSAIIVQVDGKIFFPYAGNVYVEGLTVSEVQEKIAHRLSEYVRNPQITVQVAKFRNRNVFVLGEVKDPGQQPITDKPLTVMEAISVAGGIDTNSADPSHIYVIRGSYQSPDVYWLDMRTPQSLIIAEKFPLQENDIVYISSAVLTGVNRSLNQILPSVTTYVIAKGLASK